MCSIMALSFAMIGLHMMNNRKVFISMVGNLVGAAVRQDTAVKQLHEMISGELAGSVEDAKEHGEVRKSFKTRIVYVELDEN